MGRATHFVGTADLLQWPLTGGRRVRAGPGADILPVARSQSDWRNG